MAVCILLVNVDFEITDLRLRTTEKKKAKTLNESSQSFIGKD